MKHLSQNFKTRWPLGCLGTFRMLIIHVIAEEANNVFLEAFLSIGPRESPSKRIHLTDGPEKGFHNTQLKASDQGCQTIPRTLHHPKVINAGGVHLVIKRWLGLRRQIPAFDNVVLQLELHFKFASWLIQRTKTFLDLKSGLHRQTLLRLNPRNHLKHFD